MANLKDPCDCGCKSTPCIENDIQQIVEAVTNLADKSIRPIVRVIDVLGTNLGDGKTEPRLKFNQIQDTGTALINSFVGLTERLATLALDVVGPRRGSESGDTANTVAIAAQPGSELKIPMAVENPGREPLTDLAFTLVALRGPKESSLSESAFTVRPAKVTIQPGDFEKLYLQVKLPETTPAGCYEGEIGLSGTPTLRVPFRFMVK